MVAVHLQGMQTIQIASNKLQADYQMKTEHGISRSLEDNIEHVRDDDKDYLLQRIKYLL